MIIYRDMGKSFKVVYIAKTVNEANQYVTKFPGCGVIAERFGIILIAENRELKQ